MAEIVLTNGMICLVDDGDYPWLNQWRWIAVRNFGRGWYVQRQFWNDGSFKSIRMHRLIMNAPIGIQVDHINNDGLDNRRSNLRFATPQQNAMNRFSRKAASGYKGVYKRPGRRGWYARIQVNRKIMGLGVYGTIGDAARAYDSAAIQYFGEFANLNFPS